MGFGRSRFTGVAAALLAMLVAVGVPITLSGANAGAAGAKYNLHTWTDPKGDQHRVRWNPCQTITYAVNARLAGGSDRARRRAIADVKSAFHRAGKRTGLNFSYSGRTVELPNNSGDKSWATRQKAAEIVVAWVDPSRPKYLDGSHGQRPALPLPVHPEKQQVASFGIKVIDGVAFVGVCQKVAAPRNEVHLVGRAAVVGDR